MGLKEKAEPITIDPEAEPKEVAFDSNVKFCSYAYKQVVAEEDTQATTRAMGRGLSLKNGVYLPRQVQSGTSTIIEGDGIGSTANGMVFKGRNIVAINKFSKEES